MGESQRVQKPVREAGERVATGRMLDIDWVAMSQKIAKRRAPA
jgi:hypothetical protein